MFDTALASDNPAVKKALRNFMMVTALVHAQEDDNERTMGPFETLLERIDALERAVHSTRTTPYNPYDYHTTWVSTGTPYISSSSSSSSVKHQDLKDLLKDLKIK